MAEPTQIKKLYMDAGDFLREQADWADKRQADGMEDRIVIVVTAADDTIFVEEFTTSRLTEKLGALELGKTMLIDRARESADD